MKKRCPECNSIRVVRVKADPKQLSPGDKFVTNLKLMMCKDCEHVWVVEGESKNARTNAAQTKTKAS